MMKTKTFDELFEEYRKLKRQEASVKERIESCIKQMQQCVLEKIGSVASEKYSKDDILQINDASKLKEIYAELHELEKSKQREQMNNAIRERHEDINTFGPKNSYYQS